MSEPAGNPDRPRSLAQSIGLGRSDPTEPNNPGPVAGGSRQIRPGNADQNLMPKDADTAYVVHAAIDAAIATFMEHSEAAAAGDVRGVHQSRVGLRRLRSHLRTFRRVIDIEWAAALSAEASWLADSLGAMRDLDVLKTRLVEGAMLQVPEQAPAIAGLVAILEIQRAEALEKHLEVRATARFTGLVGRLDEAARVMPGRPLGEEPAEYLIPKLLQRSWRELRNAARAARKDPTIENLHTVRIRAKRMRYANEAAIPVLGSAARQTARASEALQERLGEWHDASAARSWLEHAARRHPDLAPVAVRLASLETTAAEVAGSGWGSEFRVIKAEWRKIEKKDKKNYR
jgi:CHAD domain-containing protein